MNKKFWMSFAAYLAPTFPLGYFWHLNVFKEQYDRLEMYRDDVLIPLGLASMLLQALLFSYLYPKIYSTARSAWRRGAVHFGLGFGLLAWSFAVLPVAAKYRTASVADFLVLETAFTCLQFLVVAPMVALANREE